jgi:hypothetical protein
VPSIKLTVRAHSNGGEPTYTPMARLCNQPQLRISKYNMPLKRFLTLSLALQGLINPLCSIHYSAVSFEIYTVLKYFVPDEVLKDDYRRVPKLQSYTPVLSQCLQRTLPKLAADTVYSSAQDTMNKCQ